MLVSSVNVTQCHCLFSRCFPDLDYIGSSRVYDKTIHLPLRWSSSWSFPTQLPLILTANYKRFQQVGVLDNNTLFIIAVCVVCMFLVCGGRGVHQGWPWDFCLDVGQHCFCQLDLFYIQFFCNRFYCYCIALILCNSFIDVISYC